MTFKNIRVLESITVAPGPVSSIIASHCYDGPTTSPRDDFYLSLRIVQGRLTVLCSINRLPILKEEALGRNKLLRELLFALRAEFSALTWSQTEVDLSLMPDGYFSWLRTQCQPILPEMTSRSIGSVLQYIDEHADAGVLTVVICDRSRARYKKIPKRRDAFAPFESFSVDWCDVHAARSQWGAELIDEGIRYANMQRERKEQCLAIDSIVIIDGVPMQLRHSEAYLAECASRRDALLATTAVAPEAGAATVAIDESLERRPLTSHSFSLVEMIAEPDECAFDQACKFGNRVGGHAVYCHNDQWKDAPRKCRRTRYTGGVERDEDCEGFQPNPARVNGSSN
jgi:hypothetical protein